MIVSGLKYLLLAVAAAVFLIRRRRLRGTTLMGPWWWSFGSLLSIAAVDIALDFGAIEPGRGAAWQLLAATSTLCPGIALLGAKRPQDRGWQWIVASLWLILALPGLQQLVMQKSGALEIHPARSWFLLGIGLFGIANSVVSRHGLAVLMAGWGQIGVLGPFLPSSLPFLQSSWKAGVIALFASVLLTVMTSRGSRRERPFDSLWLDFRNSFGLVWSLRFMEQVNLISQSNGWNVILQWSGFHARNGSSEWRLEPDQVRVLRQSMTNLLRRFVSAEWIASRLGEQE